MEVRHELKAARALVSVTLIKRSGIRTPLARHTADHADGFARIPPPVHDLVMVAAAMLDAAGRVRRNVTVDGAGPRASRDRAI